MPRLTTTERNLGYGFEVLIMPGANRAKNDVACLMPEIGSGMLGALLVWLSLALSAHPSRLTARHGHHHVEMTCHVPHRNCAPGAVP